MTIQEILEAHKHYRAYVADDYSVGVTCTCGEEILRRGMLSDGSHRAHLDEVLEKHMQEREVALLSEVADEAIEKYADKPYSPGHVIRLLLSRANELRKAATNGR